MARGVAGSQRPRGRVPLFVNNGAYVTLPFPESAPLGEAKTMHLNKSAKAIKQDSAARHKSGGFNTQSAGSDATRFVGFVDLLASKSDDERQQILILALHEAHQRVVQQPQADVAGARGFSGAFVRRSASADELRRANCARPRSAPGGSYSPLAVYGDASTSRLPAHRRRLRVSACSTDGIHSIGQDGPSHVPFEVRMHEIRHALNRQCAARSLQAGWRGWQHRRFFRFLCARRIRHRRLTFLWRLENTTCFLIFRAATLSIQTAWRAHAVRSHTASLPHISPALPSVSFSQSTKHSKVLGHRLLETSVGPSERTSAAMPQVFVDDGDGHSGFRRDHVCFEHAHTQISRCVHWADTIEEVRLYEVYRDGLEEHGMEHETECQLPWEASPLDNI